MKQLLLFVMVTTIGLTGCSQTSNQSKNTKHVGGNCEGCAAIYESPVALEKLTNTATLPDYNEPGPKLEISGVVYQRDGKTPAKDVVIYVYHTDQTGHYTPGPNAQGGEKRHGRIRGWMKTDKNEYYIDEYLFEGDPFLTASERSRQEKRGGNGIISLEQKNGTLNGKRNIILGLNIPDYKD